MRLNGEKVETIPVGLTIQSVLKHKKAAIAAFLVIAIAAAYLLRIMKNDPDEAAAADLRYDIQTVTPSWLAGKLRLPEPYSTRLQRALDDPSEFEMVLRDYFLHQPVLRGLPSTAQGQVVTNYRKGILKLEPNPAVPFHLPLAWDQEDGGLNYLSQLHSLRFLPPLLEEYRLTNEKALLETVEDVFLDWVDKNPFSSPLHPRAWLEGSVARRIRVLAHLLNFYKESAVPHKSTLTLLLSSLYQHAQFLTQNRTYMDASNHGMRQDWGLLIAAYAVPEFKMSRPWMNLALTRLKDKQIHSAFSEEGVSLEHSPSYHHYSSQMIMNIASFLKENNYTGDLSWLDDFRNKSDYYLTHVLTPLGKFPPVGDSVEKGLGEVSDDDELLYSASSGRTGTPPAQLDGFFPSAGQVIFRDGWGTGREGYRNALYIHMHAANHYPGRHRHADELSFVVHAFGRWWILETGKYGYEHDHMRRYALSSLAHNGYTFNGRGLERGEKSGLDNDVYFEETLVSTPRMGAARAHSYRFREPGTKVTRTYIFLRERLMLLLLDELTAREKGMWNAYLHLAPDMNVAIEKLRAFAETPDTDGIGLEIVTEEGKTHTIRAVRGREDPPLGWYSPGYNEIVPTTTLIFERPAGRLLVSTVLRFRGKDQPEINTLRTREFDDYNEISWTENGRSFRIDVNKNKQLQVSFVSGT